MDAPPVHYVTTSDGYDIAYCVTGAGQPLVYMHPLGHVQNDWLGPATEPWVRALSHRVQLVQYDCRGQGMSTRGLRADGLLDGYAQDLETLVDHLRLQRFIIFGSFWFGHVAVRYAVEHGERIDALILLHCTTSGQAVLSVPELARRNWDVFLETLVTAPNWSAEQRLAGIEAFRASTTQPDYLVREPVLSASDISDYLPRLTMPVLVLHARDNNRLSPNESVKLAAAIPKAQFTLIEGSGQLGDAASGVSAIDAFLSGLPSSVAHRQVGRLSQREVEVLRLLAAGRSNQQIADELVISLNTVRRHVSNIFDKTGAVNRAQAAVYARDHGLA